MKFGTLAMVGLSLAVASSGLAQRQRGAGPKPDPRVREFVDRATRGSMNTRYTMTRFQEVFLDGDWRRGTEQLVVAGARKRIEYAKDSPLAGQVVIDNGRKRQHYFPSTNEIMELPRGPEEFIMRLRRLGEGAKGGLKVEILVGGTIAGRPTEQLSVMDRSGNPLQRVWIDARTGVLLKREAFDLSGRRVALTEASKINYDAEIKDSDFKISRAGAKVVTPEQVLRRVSKKEGLKPFKLNDRAFQLESVRAKRFGEHPGISQLYVGPRGKVTLFQLKGKVDASKLRKLGDRAGEVHVWVRDGVTFVLLGNIPAQQLESLGGTLTELK